MPDLDASGDIAVAILRQYRGVVRAKLADASLVTIAVLIGGTVIAVSFLSDRGQVAVSVLLADGGVVLTVLIEADTVLMAILHASGGVVPAKLFDAHVIGEGWGGNTGTNDNGNYGTYDGCADQCGLDRA